MVCVYCGNKTTVANSRSRQGGLQVWRRRVCDTCKAVFTTWERVELELSMMVKSANDLRPFSRDNLFLSIYDSLRHRKTALADATALTDTTTAKLVPIFVDGSIERQDIVDIVGSTLEHFDVIAATHYRAFHKD